MYWIDNSGFVLSKLQIQVFIEKNFSIILNLFYFHYYKGRFVNSGTWKWPTICKKVTFDLFINAIKIMTSNTKVNKSLEVQGPLTGTRFKHMYNKVLNLLFQFVIAKIIFSAWQGTYPPLIHTQEYLTLSKLSETTEVNFTINFLGSKAF